MLINNKKQQYEGIGEEYIDSDGSYMTFVKSQKVEPQKTSEFYCM